VDKLSNLFEDLVKRPIWKFLKIDVIAGAVSANDQYAKEHIRKIESLVQVGVDIHVKGESWAVICIAGKPEYVQFRRLRQQDARYLQELLKAMRQNYGSVAVDAPPGMREFLDDLK